MYKYDVSVLMPAIRTHMWSDVYSTLLKSCKRHTFELVLISPFDLPEDLKGIDNIKLIKDFGCPTRCAQIGVNYCEGELLYHCVDDARFLEDSIDLCIDQYRQTCTKKDVINMRYREGQNFSGKTLDLIYWVAHHHSDLRLKGIPENFKISLHHMLSLEYFKELGGWDCRFEYINHSLHDLMFRIQEDGGIVYNSNVDVTNCDHYAGRSVDHAAVHDAQVYFDAPKFLEIYSSKPHAAKDRIKIDLDNWKQQPDYWERRFKGIIPREYSDLLKVNY